jgi:endonuclease/exonuclease/phosphatase family metal-dependent hydrolase
VGARAYLRAHDLRQAALRLLGWAQTRRWTATSHGAGALLGPEWLAHRDCHGPVVLGRDSNALSASPVWRRLRSRLNDAQMGLESHRPRRTFFGRFPAARSDYVFVAPGLDGVEIEVPDTEPARVASDPLPLIVEVGLDRCAHF